jgi:hypothetical protein
MLPEELSPSDKAAYVYNGRNSSRLGVSVCRAGRIIAKDVAIMTYDSFFLPDALEVIRHELSITRLDPEKVP